MSKHEPTLAEALRTKALCETGHHAEAVAALLGAAAAILCLRFPPAVAAELVVEIAEQSLALASPVGRS